jgi:hypothetical protein
MSQKYPILLVDDEYSDVSDLEDLINNIGFKAGHRENLAQLYESCEEAIEFMQEQRKLGLGISALISDNHIGTSQIDGDDFLRILNGKLLYCFSKLERDQYSLAEHFSSFQDIQRFSNRRNDAILNFMKCSFRDMQDYVSFYRYYYGNKEGKLPTIMLCGNPREADITGLNETYLIGKGIRSNGAGAFCEKKVLGILNNLGLFDRKEVSYVVESHQRLSHPDPKKREYNPCSNPLKKKVFLRKRAKSSVVK